MTKKQVKFLLIMVLAPIFLSACTLPWKKTEKNILTPENNQTEKQSETEVEVTNTKRIKKFATTEDLKAFLRINSFNQNLTYFQKNNLSESVPEITLGADFNYLEANKSVFGLDKASIIKTDGRNIYVLVRNELKIIEVDDENNPQIVSSLKFNSRPESVFVNDKSLIVLENSDSTTLLKIFDISDITKPKLSRDLVFEGDYAQLRLIGDYAYLITTSPGIYKEGEALTPKVIDSGVVLNNACEAEQKCFAPEVYYFDIAYDSLSFTSVTAINTKDQAAALSGQVYLLNNGQNFYVSDNNIFITYAESFNEHELEQKAKREVVWPQLSIEDKNKISEIEAAGQHILTADEKQIKIAVIIDAHLNRLEKEVRDNLLIEIETVLENKLLATANQVEKTVIHKIGIKDGQLQYRGMGEVGGRMLNQFSLNEHEGYLRIATTRSQLWSRFNDSNKKSFNNIYVLNNELKLISSLENLAIDEVIYAARFIGNRAYLITYKQTDPLYVIDLSDVLKPNVLGAIKIPGYTTYLHPVDQNGTKLFGLGRETSVDSDNKIVLGGLKLALFDFTDLKAPKELSSMIIGDSLTDSIALKDRKAFFYSPEKEVLAIPAVMKTDNKINFGGAFIFQLADNQLVLKGQVDHSAGGQAAAADYWNSFDYYDNTVKRSLIIDNNLYTFSNQFLQVNSLDDAKLLQTVVLTGVIEDYNISQASDELPADSDVNSEMNLETGPDIDAEVNLETVPETEIAPNTATTTVTATSSNTSLELETEINSNAGEAQTEALPEEPVLGEEVI